MRKGGEADRIESDEGHKQTDVSLSELIPCDVALLGENVFALIQRLEQLIYSLVVGALCECESTSVDAVVDGVIRPRVDLIDATLEMGRKQIHLRVLCVLVELIVEHFYDFRALVVDNRLRLLVPQYLTKSQMFTLSFIAVS